MRSTDSDSPLRVLEFVADGAAGGGTTHVGQILRAFKHTYTLGLVTQRGSYLEEEAHREGVEVFGGQWFGASLLPRSLRELARVLREFQPDVVHCHGGRAAFFYSLLRQHLPMLYTVHGLHYARRSAAGRVAGRWQHRRAMSAAAHVIFVCQYDRRLALQDCLMAADKAHSVIYNGIAFPTLPAAADGSSSRIRTEAERPIGFVGRLVAQKHPELFLEVVDRLPNQTATMVGGGPLAEAVDAEIARRGLGQRVRRLGELDRHATLVAIADLSVLVMTSRWEGLPLLPLEAMHLGVPVVATAVGGVTEVIEHERTGLMTDESPAALAAAVQRLQSDPALRQAIVEAARRDVCQRFAEQSMIDAIEVLYGRLSATASPSELVPGAAT